jgi:sigma-B regulation protein RsbU (phosphoserine phosphatase)
MAAKILFVDDEPDMEMLIKRRFRHATESGQFALIYATNGVDALAKLREHADVDIILTDINMPEMDGLTLLTHLNQMHSPIKAVIVSAYGDMENIRTAMNRGAFDFITKPINFDDLTLTIEKTIKFVQQQKDHRRALEENLRMSQELQIASSIQRKLLPQTLPKIFGLDVAAFHEPAMEIGGDYYDFLHHSHYDLGVIVADVAGKGTSAAFYMAQIKGIIHALSRMHPSPKEMLKQANALLHGHLSKSVFITALCGVFKLAEQKFSFSRAGHCPLLYFSSKQNSAEFFKPDGLGLGIDSGKLFDSSLEEMEIPFSKKDIFVFFTDGISEAKNEKREEYSSERLQEIIQTKNDWGADQMVNEIIRDIRIFENHSVRQDDITLVIVKIK